MFQVFVKTESQKEGYIQLALQAYQEAMATSTASWNKTYDELGFKSVYKHSLYRIPQ